MRYLVGMIPAVHVVFKERLIALATHFHEHVGCSHRRRGFLLRDLAGPVRAPRAGRPIHLRVKVVRLLPVQVLLVDLDSSKLDYPVSLDGGFDHFADLDVVEAAEQSTLASHLAFGKVELIHSPRQAIGTVVELGMALGNPRVIETLVDGDTLVHIDGQHAVDEVQGRVSDAVPIRGGVVKFSHFDLLAEVVGV